jgi:hypothetical protein
MPKRPIGQILLDRNEISAAELAAALAEQERTGLRLGQILIETGRISWLALARAIAEQVLDIQDVESQPMSAQAVVSPPVSPPAPTPVTPALHPVATPVEPAPAPMAPQLIQDPEIKLHSVEALLKERQRAFIELVTTTETLRMKVAHLEEIIEERDRELAKLRVSRAV